MKEYNSLYGIESELIINLDDPSQSGVRYSSDAQALMDANAALRNAEVGQVGKHIGKHDGALGYKIASFDAGTIMWFKFVHNLDFFNKDDRDVILKMVDTDPALKGFKCTNDRIT